MHKMESGKPSAKQHEILKSHDRSDIKIFIIFYSVPFFCMLVSVCALAEANI